MEIRIIIAVICGFVIGMIFGVGRCLGLMKFMAEELKKRGAGRLGREVDGV